MRIEQQFDWHAPDYDAIFKARAQRIKQMREDPAIVNGLKEFYKQNPSQFIIDWGITLDPKNLEKGLPALIPFILFPKQIEWVDWIFDNWKSQKPGITEKTRQMGMSWLSVAVSCTLCLFHKDMSIGFGSRKEDYVDKIGDPKSLFHKARTFLNFLPAEFANGFDIKKDAPFMRIMFPTGSIITGEAGDNIGRGATTGLYFVDESAFLEHPKLVDAALSQTTNCRQDISTPNGLGNSFAERRFSGKVNVFTFHWRDDPRKDEAWYAKQVAELDPVTVAQELDINYSASVEGVVIPSLWVQAAVDAHVKLNIEVSGERTGALDVADEGVDLNAFVGRYGILIDHTETWSGINGDIFKTVEHAFRICDNHNYNMVQYDADGLGAGVRGDARIINESRQGNAKQIKILPFRGSAAVLEPEKELVKGRKNKDFFANAKAQAWWSLRLKFQNTYRAVVEKERYDPDNLISISSTLQNLGKIIAELSQPTYTVNTVGKIVIDKKPDGTKSPNLADAIMINFAPKQKVLNVSSKTVDAFMGMTAWQ